jgi:hypothetical protein
MHHLFLYNDIIIAFIIVVTMTVAYATMIVIITVGLMVLWADGSMVDKLMTTTKVSRVCNKGKSDAHEEG